MLVNGAESTRGRRQDLTFSSQSFLSPSEAKRGAIFAIMVQFLLRAGVIAVQTFWRPGLTHGAGFGSKPPGAVSRYKAPAGAINNSRYRNFGSGQMRVSGCPEHDKLSRKQEQNAKIVTSLLTLPSVLGVRHYLISSRFLPLYLVQEICEP